IAHVASNGLISSSLITNSDLQGGSYTNITTVGTLTGLGVNGNSTFTGNVGVTGATTLTADQATTTPLSIQGASGQSGDYLDITSFGSGSTGNVFKVDSNGVVSGNGSGLTNLN